MYPAGEDNASKMHPASCIQNASCVAQSSGGADKHPEPQGTQEHSREWASLPDGPYIVGGTTLAARSGPCGIISYTQSTQRRAVQW